MYGNSQQSSDQRTQTYALDEGQHRPSPSYQEQRETRKRPRPGQGVLTWSRVFFLTLLDLLEAFD